MNSSDDDLQDALREMERRFGITPDEDLQSWLDTVFCGGFDVEFGDDPSAEIATVGSDGEYVEEPDTEGEVLVAYTDLAEFWIPESEVPEWIDVERELPVRV